MLGSYRTGKDLGCKLRFVTTIMTQRKLLFLILHFCFCKMKPIHVIKSVTGSRARYEIDYEACYISPQELSSASPNSLQINEHCPSVTFKPLQPSSASPSSLPLIFSHESNIAAFSSNITLTFSFYPYFHIFPSARQGLLSPSHYQNPTHSGRLR